MNGPYVVRDRPPMGRGLFAARSFKKGDFIVEYTGKKIPNKLADALKTRYLFELDEKWTIDAEDGSNIARYINHACAPNAEADTHDGHILIAAAKKIALGEEITINYGEEYFDEFIKPEGCKCKRCAMRSR